MKKIFNLLCCALFVSTLFIACGGPNDPDDNNGNDTTTITPPVNLRLVTAEDYIVSCSCKGEQNGAYKFVITLQDKAIMSFMGNIVDGSGDIYSLEIYSKSAKNFYPEMTKYAIGSTTAPYLVAGGKATGSGILVVDEDQAPQGENVPLKSGYIVLSQKGSDYKIDIDIKLTDGSSRAISYTGVMSTSDDNPFAEEDATKRDVVMENAEFENMMFGPQLVNEKTDVLSFQFFDTQGEGEIWVLVPAGCQEPNHEYTFSDSGEPWTAFTSPGMDGMKPKPSYVALVMQKYFLTGGTVVVSDDGDKIVVNATSAKGSTFKINASKHKGNL